MPKLHRAAIALLVLSHPFALALTAEAAPPNRRAINQVSQLILNSYEQLTKHNDTKAARLECEKALKLEEKFDNDPFIAATVNVCFGDVEDHEQNTAAACQHYNEALKEFQATPARHPAQRVLKTQIKVLEGKIFYLSCATGAAEKREQP